MIRQWLKGLLVGVLLVCGGLVTGSTSAHAAVPYTLKPMRVTALILRNGDANVTETMTYHFNEDYQGVYNTVALRGLRGGQLVAVNYQLNHRPVVTAQSATTHAAQTYQLTRTAAQLKVQLHQPVGVGDQLRVTYRYHLRGLVTNYRDTAEINWRIIANSWAVPLQDVTLVIQLPAKKVAALQAWTHGPAAGKTRVERRAGRVTMTVAQNPANTAIESRLLFPTQVTAANPQRRDRAQKAIVQRQEAKLAAATQARQRQKRLRQFIGYWGLASVVAVTLLGAGWWLWRHPANRYAQPTPIHHFFDVPQVAPGLAEALVDLRWPSTDALTGDIMAAAGRQEVAITTEPATDTVRLTKTGTVTNAFLQPCFTHLGAHDSFTLAELAAFSEKDEQGLVGQWFQDWQGQINTAAQDYQDAANFRYHRWLWWLALGLTGEIAVWLLFAWVIGHQWLVETVVTSGLLLLLIWGYLRGHCKVSYYNAKGLQVVNEVRGFRQMLKDVGHFNTAKVGDLVLWAQILPYAAAFGLTQQVTQQLAHDFGQERVSAALADAYPLYDVGNFNQPLIEIIGVGVASAVSNSLPAGVSPSGQSGGFLGGGSGGAGGFGGGAF